MCILFTVYMNYSHLSGKTTVNCLQWILRYIISSAAQMMSKTPLCPINIAQLTHVTSDKCTNYNYNSKTCWKLWQMFWGEGSIHEQWFLNVSHQWETGRFPFPPPCWPGHCTTNCWSPSRSRCWMRTEPGAGQTAPLTQHSRDGGRWLAAKTSSCLCS